MKRRIRIAASSGMVCEFADADADGIDAIDCV